MNVTDFRTTSSTAPAGTPLAERMRPRTLDEFVGQAHCSARAGRCGRRSSAARCTR